ncbi:MAG: hypothetical protein AB3N63_03530 [Puniceicoccaceae bacterium]
MKKLIPMILFPVLAFAQNDFYSFDDDVYELSAFEVSAVSSGRYDPRYRGGVQSNCPIRIKKRADIVTLKLTVSSIAKKPEDRIRLLKDTFQLLSTKAKAEKQILFKSGFVALPLVTGNFFSSGKSEDQVSSFDFTLIAKLGPEDSIFERMDVLNEFVEEIDFNKEVNVYFKSSGVALMKPDQYRKELLQMIGEELELLKSTFGETTMVSINGLDQRVRVQQLDDVNLEIFIPYNMVVRTGEFD